jgi:hypothetical protein
MANSTYFELEPADVDTLNKFGADEALKFYYLAGKCLYRSLRATNPVNLLSDSTVVLEVYRHCIRSRASLRELQQDCIVAVTSIPGMNPSVSFLYDKIGFAFHLQDETLLISQGPRSVKTQFNSDGTPQHTWYDSPEDQC